MSSSYDSPLAHPEGYINKVQTLSDEVITVDKGVAHAKRDAEDFANKHAGNLKIVSELQATTKAFSDRWTGELRQSRDGASAISARFKRFVEVFLSLVGDITSDQDRQEVIGELKSFLAEPDSLRNYKFDGLQAVKAAFTEIEGLMAGEANHVIRVLELSKDIKKTVEELQKELAPVKAGCEKLRQVLNRYAERLE